MTSKTAQNLKPSEWKRYKPFMTAYAEGDQTAVLVADAHKLAKEIAKGLGDVFRAKKVKLFGSLARGDYHPRSDIDLAVWGIPDSKFYRAVAFATGFSKEWKVDLVDGDDCGVALSEVIAREGVEL